MSRCYKEVGLKNEAHAWLEKNVNKIPGTECPTCKTIITWKQEVIDIEHEDSFYGDGPDLSTYKCKDGRLVKEINQAEPWSSGPVCFKCLEIGGKRMFEWTEEEIQERL